MINHMGKEDYATTTWSGGETTELFIYPENSTLADRDFKLRISSATVNVPRSEFSDFSGYKRFLQILEGQIELTHGNEPTKELSAFDSSYFSGATPTVSEGECRDFNVIYRPEITIETAVLTENESYSFGQVNHYFVFNAHPTTVTVEIGQEITELAHFDSLLVESETAELINKSDYPLIVIAWREDDK